MNWTWVKSLKDPRIVTELLYDFYDALPTTLMTSLTLECLKDKLKIEKNRLKILL